MNAPTRHPPCLSLCLMAFLAGVLLLGMALPAPAGLPDEPAQKAQVIGQPASLLIQPEVITLAGPRAHQQIVVTGRYADGSLRDLTGFCTLTCEGEVAVIGDEGYVQP